MWKQTCGVKLVSFTDRQEIWTAEQGSITHNALIQVTNGRLFVIEAWEWLVLYMC